MNKEQDLCAVASAARFRAARAETGGGLAASSSEPTLLRGSVREAFTPNVVALGADAAQDGLSAHTHGDAALLHPGPRNLPPVVQFLLNSQP